MIEAKVIGIKDISYVSKKTGANVSGRQLNVSYPSKDVDGLEVGTIYVSATAPEYKEFVSCKLGDSVQFVTSFQYGRYTNVFVRKA